MNVDHFVPYGRNLENVSMIFGSDVYQERRRESGLLKFPYMLAENYILKRSWWDFNHAWEA